MRITTKLGAQELIEDGQDAIAGVLLSHSSPLFHRKFKQLYVHNPLLPAHGIEQIGVLEHFKAIWNCLQVNSLELGYHG